MIKPVIYTCRGSRGLRAVWAAEEVGRDYDLVMLPFPPRQKARDYLAINPLGTVPALVDHRGFVMTESSAIAHYLASWPRQSEFALLPDDPDYSNFLDFLHHADTTLTFPLTIFLRFSRFETEGGLQEAGEAYANWFRARLKKTDSHLGSREYLCGDRFTVADIAIAYAFLLADQIGLGCYLSPVQRAFLERTTARPAFQRAVARELVAS